MRVPDPTSGTAAGLLAMGLLAAGLLAVSKPAAAAEACALPVKTLAQGALLGEIPFQIPSNAMLPTFGSGGHVGVKPIVAGLGTSRGDVVAFCRQGDPNTIFVLRIVALAGDRIALDRGTVLINGQALAREPAGTVDYDGPAGRRVLACFRETNGTARYRICLDPAAGALETMPERTVPAGHVFVLGDNRDYAADSRVPETGFVAEASVVGRATSKTRGAAAVPVDAE